ncbi:hypothetical protein ACHAXS_011560 [Conticribra weissflogii]
MKIISVILSFITFLSLQAIVRGDHGDYVDMCVYVNGKLGYHTVKVEEELCNWMIKEGAYKGKCHVDQVEVHPDDFDDHLKSEKSMCLKLYTHKFLFNGHKRSNVVRRTVETTKALRIWLLKHGVRRGPCDPPDHDKDVPVTYMTITDDYKYHDHCCQKYHDYKYDGYKCCHERA